MDINIYHDFLSPAEVAFLTGKKRQDKVIEQLNKQGIPFVLNAANQPIVRRDYHIKGRSSKLQDERGAKRNETLRGDMTRPRKRENQGLPKNLLCRKRRSKKGIITCYYFYHLGKGKEKSLGKDKLFAVLEAAKLNIVSPQKLARALFIEVAKRYELEVMPLKAKNTITSNKRAIKRLVQFFGDPPIALEDIEPKHIRMYLEWRKDKTASANLEVSLFNHIWNTAREWGYTNQISPTTGIKKYQVKFRDIYVEDYILDKHLSMCRSRYEISY